MADRDKIRSILDLAKGCVHKGQAPQALELLNTIRFEIEDLSGQSEWAEHELFRADALAAMNAPSAEVAFEDALRRCDTLGESDLHLRMHVHGDYGKYLAGCRAIKRSREHYQRAEAIATELNLDECVAHFQMCLIRLCLE